MRQRSHLVAAGLGVVVALCLTTALIAGRGGAGQPLPYATPSLGPAVPTATPTTPVLEPGETISFPPVPSPTPTDRSLTSPDRLDSPLPQVSPPGFADPPAGTGLDRYTSQTLDWADCTLEGTHGDCATVLVPLDYGAPDAQAITLSLFKRPATATPYLGTLFVNPGGPGEPGRELAAGNSIDFAKLAGYDIIGWDPRGTGESTPVDCGDPSGIDRVLALDSTPDTPAATQALFDGWKQFGLDCLAHSGPLLAHVSTQETVADLDILRGLVGSAKLNYLGYSYGTLIGALYAQTYPGLVGRMVLDSPVNITDDDSISQAAGFDQALDTYAAWCARSTCGLGSTAPAVIAAITALLDQLGTQPLPAGDRHLTQSLAVDGISLYLYFDESAWTDLTHSIQWAQQGDGRYLLAAADAMWGRDATGNYALFPAFAAIGCLDSADSGIAGAETDWAEAKASASVFGTYFGIDATCVQWPVKPVDLPVIHAAGAAPILVVGATGDPATPYAYAPWMAGQLASGVLLTYDGAGHATSFNGRSSCVDTAVAAYLTGARVPPNGLYCT